METWEFWISEYATYLQAGDLSAGTVRLRRHYLRRLGGALGGRGPAAVDTGHLVGWLAADQWSPETRRSALSAVRGFYRWAHLMGHVEHDPAARLPKVTVPSGRPRPAPEAVLARALTVAGDRERLMLLLAGYAGLRCCEIAPVHREHLVDGVLRVTGKGRKVRTVPIIDSRLLEAIASADGWVFPNGRGSHLTAGRVSELLSEALPDGWTGHTLRHRMATRAYAGTRDLLAVGELLGHSKPETTKRYVEMPMDALLAAVTAAA